MKVTISSVWKGTTTTLFTGSPKSGIGTKLLVYIMALTKPTISVSKKEMQSWI